jgi:phospholipid transport system substrate-binding protein
MQLHAKYRRGLVIAVAGLLIGQSVPARAEPGAASVDPIQQLNNGLVQVMKAGSGTPFEQRFEMLAPIVDKAFNLQTILQESVGPSWASLPPDQQSMLLAAFRRYTVASYVNSFDDYDGQKIDLQPEPRTVANGEQVVATKIIPKSGDQHEIDYVMRDGGNGWQVVDVLADGSISRVAVQRSDFRQLLANGGAQALAQRLRTKTADLSDGNG